MWNVVYSKYKMVLKSKNPWFIKARSLENIPLGLWSKLNRFLNGSWPEAVGLKLIARYKDRQQQGRAAFSGVICHVFVLSRASDFMPELSKIFFQIHANKVYHRSPDVCQSVRFSGSGRQIAEWKGRRWSEIFFPLHQQSSGPFGRLAATLLLSPNAECVSAQFRAAVAGPDRETALDFSGLVSRGWDWVASGTSQ